MTSALGNVASLPAPLAWYGDRIARRPDRDRRTVLGHALLSYLFGTVVIAVATNPVTGPGQS
jgi:MFS family permease